MTYLVDSDRLISFLNGREATVSLLASLAPGGLSVSVVSYGEVLDGVLGAREPHTARQRADAMFRNMALLDVTAAVAEEYARVARGLRERGALIPANDLWIAATALAHGLTLVTGNRRHFERVPGLALL